MDSAGIRLEENSIHMSDNPVLFFYWWLWGSQSQLTSYLKTWRFPLLLSTPPESLEGRVSGHSGYDFTALYIDHKHRLIAWDLKKNEFRNSLNIVDNIELFCPCCELCKPDNNMIYFLLFPANSYEEWPQGRAFII